MFAAVFLRLRAKGRLGRMRASLTNEGNNFLKPYSFFKNRCGRVVDVLPKIKTYIVKKAGQELGGFPLNFPLIQLPLIILYITRLNLSSES